MSLKFTYVLFCVFLLANTASAVNSQGQADTLKPLTGYAKGDLTPLNFKHTGTVVPDFPFESRKGPTRLADFKGRVVVLNLWATYCAPCLKEMPSLDALQKAFDPKILVVLPVSEDRAGWRAVDSWWSKVKFPNLTPYTDKHMELGFGLSGGDGQLPMTLVYDRHGKEVARIMRPVDWNGPKALAFLKAVADRP